MPRKASGVPQEKLPTPLIIAEHLPTDPAALGYHVGAGWTAMKADTTHFPSPPETATLDTALTNLGNALNAVPNGGKTETATVKATATVVRELWGSNARYAQKVLRTLPVEQVPPILANVLLYRSQTGKKKPKPPIQARRGATSGSALVILLAVARKLTYTYQWSADQNHVAVADRGPHARDDHGADAGQAVLVSGGRVPPGRDDDGPGGARRADRRVTEGERARRGAPNPAGGAHLRGAPRRGSWAGPRRSVHLGVGSRRRPRRRSGRGWTYAATTGKGIRMSVKRKSHNLDEALLRRAKRVLGASTETEAIHGALRAVLIGDEIVRDLEAARGKDIFRPEFVRQMRAERRRARSTSSSTRTSTSRSSTIPSSWPVTATELVRLGPRTFLSSVVRAELLQGAKGELGRARVTPGDPAACERVRRVVPPTARRLDHRRHCARPDSGTKDVCASQSKRLAPRHPDCVRRPTGRGDRRHRERGRLRPNPALLASTARCR